MTGWRTRTRAVAGLAVAAFLVATSFAVLHQAEHAEHVEADSCVACRVADHAPAVLAHAVLAVEQLPYLPHAAVEPVAEPLTGRGDVATARGPPSLPYVV